ncbi:MAG: BamA/TamA family outer membrane protein [candidate division WOR-3 bacterium]
MNFALLLVAFQAVPDTLGAVRFDGNRTFSSRFLLTVVSTRKNKPFTEAALAFDAAALERFYQDQGFFDVHVERSVGPGRRPTVTFSVVEGPRTKTGAVTITGNRSFSAEHLLRLVPVRPGQFLVRASIEQGTQVLRSFYLNSGFPQVAVSGSLEHKDTVATVVFDVQEGPLCHVAEVRVRGNRTVSAATIVRATELRIGERFSQGRLHRAQTRLYATKLFSRVGFVIELPDTNQDEVVMEQGLGKSRGVVVRFDVSEQPYRSVSFGGGVETPPNRLLGSIEWEHNNLFNRGHTALANVEVSPAFNRDFRVRSAAAYRMPYLLLTRIDLQFRPYFSYERIEGTSTREFGEETGMSRSPAPNLTIGLTNRLRFVSDTTTGVTNSLGLSGQYDTRDDIFDPRRGLWLQSVFEVAGGLLQGRNDFYRLTGEARVCCGLGFGFVLALRGMVGRVIPYGTRTRVVPYYEAFTLGGRSSLRGYPERSLGPDTSIQGRFGPAVVNGNLELRTPYLLNWIGLVGFADLGTVSRDLRLFAYEYSGGTGVRIRTPIGPVRLDWGRRLANPVPGDKGRFYLGLLHAF